MSTKAAMRERRRLLRQVAHAVERRCELINRHAPKEWIVRITDEIENWQQQQALLELEIQDALDQQRATMGGAMA